MPLPHTRILLALALASALGLGACSGLEPDEAERETLSEPSESSPGEASGALAGADAENASSGVEDDAGEAAGASEEAADPALADALATVNGEILPLSEFQRQAFDTQRYHVDQGGIDPNSEEGQRKLLFLRRQVLNDMIDQMLIEQAAAEMGIRVDDDEVEARMAVFIDEIGGEDAFEASLEDAGTTRDEVFEMERASLVGRKMLERIAADLPETAEFVRARHVLCATAEDCQRARQRIVSGEDFADVAGELSQDATSRDRGGDLDWVSRGMLLSSQLEEALFELEDGQLSEVIETDLGFHVIELTDRDPARELPAEQRAQLEERALLEWLSERRAESEIDIFVEDLREPEDAG